MKATGELAPLRRWQLLPRRWHRLIGRHVQTTRASSPLIFGGWQAFTITCSCGCTWDVVR